MSSLLDIASEPSSPELPLETAPSSRGLILPRAHPTHPHHPHLQLALELTQIPTAAGREQSVIAYIERWCEARPQLALTRDDAGNMVIAQRETPASTEPPLYITGHLDHPAFVVERVVAPGTLELSFRGGVMPVFFENAPITLHTSAGPVDGLLTGKSDPSTPAGQHYFAEFAVQRGAGFQPAIGDIATWKLPPAEIDQSGILHTHACDDLVAVAAALCAMEDLLAKKAKGEPIGDARLIFTRAEEIGFIGAIAACRLGTIPKGARIVALENSRAFADSPVGGGPIVRVGDRMSVFTPWLTAACAARAEQVFGHAATLTANQTADVHKGKRPWQRKLMAGGACEASVFCHAGYDATCLCLPLGNYHNMPHLADLQDGTYDAAKYGPPRCAREFIHTQDYLGLVDLLVALGTNLPSSSPLTPLLEKLYQEKKYVLNSNG